MSLIPPYPVTSHALSSSSLPQPIADLISELLKDNQTLDGQRSLLVCSAAASIQRRLGMAAVCAERDLGSMTSLLSNLVRSCMVGLPVYIRERVRIALPRHPAAAIGDPLAQLLPDYLQVALLVFFAFVPQSKLDSMSANPTATTSQKTDTRYADVGASESSGASFVRNDDSDDDVEWTMEDLARGYRVASDDRTRTIASAVSSDQWFSPRGQNFSSNLFTEDLNGYKIDTVLVMAEKGTIYSALAGALYHRRALGFPSDSPVLGLVYSTSSHGTWLHVVFAWLDETSQASVNVAHDSFENLAGRGTFDATDSNSCKRLAHFLDSVQSFLSKVPVGRHVNELWRADQVQYSRSIIGASSTTENIENWIAQTQSFTQLGPLPDEDSSVDGEIATSSTALCFNPNSSTIFLETKLKLGISSKMWLFDRGCVQDTRLLPFVGNYSALFENPELDIQEALRFRGMAPLFQSYDDATRFRLPHAWRSGTELPNVSESLKDARDTFKVAASQRQSLEEGHLGDMDDKMFHKISRFYEDILCVYLRAKDSLDKGSAAPESRICSQFDALHDMIFADADDEVIIFPLVGPTLRLPRNEQADHRLHPLMGWAMHVHDTKWGPHQRLLAAGRKALLQLHNDKQGDYTAKLALESAIRRNFARRHHRWILQDFAGAEARNSEDPLTGFCDSLCVVEIPSAIPADLLKSFEEMSLIVNPTQASMAAPADEGDHHARSAAAPTLSTERLSNSIRLPLLLSQYRQRRGPFHVGATKLRMNLTAAVKYLAALDIWNFAVFGLLTKGTAGVVVAAWAVPSTENRPTEVHILERSCCAFNLATPLGAFHYATFLSWLQLVHGKNLLEAFDDGKRQAFLERLEKGHESIQWAMRPQLWEPDSEAPDDSDGSDDSYD